VTSDDPALAEPERMELQPSQLESPGLDREAPKQPANKPDVPVFSSHRQSQSKKRAPLGALLMLALAGAGFYAAWTYQPGFQAMAHSQIDRVLALAKIARQPQFKPAAAASHLAQPPAQMAPATTSATAPGAPAGLDHTPSAVPSSSPNSATTATAGTPTASPIAPAAAPAFDAQLPGEKSAVILSSKSAEKRLEHGIPPKYTAAAQSGETQGTVVLKVMVDENGKVDGLRLVEGNAAQATAAIEAVKQWHYRPYVRDGKTLPFQTVVIVDFQRP
jgi:TonB family protein